MKVLVITSRTSDRSGWGRYGRAVIDGLLSQGIEVGLCSESIDTSYSTIDMGKLRSKKTIINFILNCITVRHAARGVDVVHALDVWPYGIYAYMACLGTQARLFMSGIGTYSVAPLYSWKTRWITSRACKRATRIFCISDYTKQQMIAAGVLPIKLTTVHMGATDLPSLTNQQKIEIQSTYQLVSQSFPIILTVGAIKERKGQFDTFKAVITLKEKYPQILYILAGSGSVRSYVGALRAYATEHSASDNILIVDEVSDSVLSFLYSACTVFALNSNTDYENHHFEGFGLVVLEAAQFGKPSVGSKDSGIEDAIKDGVSGYLTRQRDVVDIAEKIEKILSRYPFFSANAKLMRESFNWRKTVMQYIQGYKQGL